MTILIHTTEKTHQDSQSLVILSVNYDSNIPSDSQQYPDKL